MSQDANSNHRSSQFIKEKGYDESTARLLSQESRRTTTTLDSGSNKKPLNALVAPWQALAGTPPVGAFAVVERATAEN